jgi:hypothetical protein
MKNKKNKTNVNRTLLQPQKKTIGISRGGIRIIIAGIAVVTLGYLVLSRTDPAGQNWASTLSPFLLLGGYALIGIGIASPEKSVPLDGNAITSTDRK